VSEPLVLASASPRRALILQGLGVRFEVVVSHVDEVLVAGESPAESARRLAREKAAAVARGETRPVLAADTLVVVDGRVLGKPGSREEAAAMLRALAGREHDVVTGVCLIAGGRTYDAVDRTTVRFAAMSDAEIEAYVATGEPMDKAGAYHIDGRGALFVAAVAGSPSNVAGLPVRVVYALAREAGVALAADLP
jgi:septum formation protein